MSDEEDHVEEKPFAIEVAKQGRAVCKKCKQKCLQGELRIAKLVPNPFGSGKMKAWHHVNCLFEQFLKQRQATKRIEGPDDVEGWEDLSRDEKKDILKKVKECDAAFEAKFGSSKAKQKTPPKAKNVKAVDKPSTSTSNGNKHKDCQFKEFRRLVADITNEPRYLEKTNCVNKMFKEGTDGSGFKDDIVLWCRLLLPGVVKRVYNLQNKQLVKLFSKLFVADQSDMLEHLEQGDIGETIQKFFEESHKCKPAKKSTLTVKEVDDFLVELSKLTKEDEQLEHFKQFVPQCRSNDLKTVIRLIKGDLRMGAGAKHILDGVHPDAYEAYQASRDLVAVIGKCFDKKHKANKSKAEISLMTPVLPMLAEACKSVEQAMKKCPNGMYSEIKYDGERVQVHKEGVEFKYFSRHLKPVLPHKIQHFKEFIPQAFPHGKDLILDSEILMIDTITGKPLPFGTLGKHKKTEFKDATVCLFVFDCIYYNGESLVKKPLSHRKKILQENMMEIPNHVVFSEMQEINRAEELQAMIAKVLKQGLEGLVLKDVNSIYEPGKRHWLKVKKDYLFDGAMADSADLIVLGAWYGTGKKGGMMSVFLMGCYDPSTKKFCTVTRVHTGHDDKTLEELQGQLDMVKISQDMSKVPNWLSCTKTMVPDFVARNPKNQPVWEITGAEFTQHDVHTADGISIRFPRVTKIREDKDWRTATNLQELQALYAKSKEETDVSLLMKGIKTEDEATSSPKKRKKDILSYMKKEEKQPTKAAGEDSPSPSKKIKVEENVDMKEQTDSKNLDTKIDNNNDGKVQIREPIPDYFKGIKALFEDELKDEAYSKLTRQILLYFVAYGGEVVGADRWEEATHVFHFYNIIRQPTIQCPTGAKHLDVQWVKDTIVNGSVPDFRCYTVRWDPDD
ncbi:hypothetical protein NQ315_008729 [Exocentrus adspersus]|uniref:DNA ligase n=1 Tax=Exocentrus adspersus TaxID=1586481 RepID=A0AAV8W602_9CUCU|nr:hypothetical protein NQ315_008729 [Exocentrus adspersus]